MGAGDVGDVNSRRRSAAIFTVRQYYSDQGERPLDRRAISGDLCNILSRLPIIVDIRRGVLTRVKALIMLLHYTSGDVSLMYSCLWISPRWRNIAKCCVVSHGIADRCREKSPVWPELIGLMRLVLTVIRRWRRCMAPIWDLKKMTLYAFSFFLCKEIERPLLKLSVIGSRKWKWKVESWKAYAYI